MADDRHEHKLRLRSRAVRKAGAPLLAWTAAGLTKEERQKSYLASLEADFEVESPAYAALERAIQELGVRITEKHSNQFEDAIVFRTDDGSMAGRVAALPGVRFVVPRPTPKSLSTVSGVEGVFMAPIGATCSAAQAAKQGSIINTIEGPKTAVTNNGGDVIIIVWDFVPAETGDLAREELTDRPGGSLVLVDNPTDAIDSHGAAVASTAGGKFTGLASGANLVLLPLSATLSDDLSIIEAIANTSTKPVVVNMSFALEWEGQTDGGDQTRTKTSMASLDDILDDMKSRHPQLLFVVAGGNESLNPCDTAGPVSFSGCSDCYMWPQSRLGAPYGPTDIPFVLVGAAQVFDTGAARRIAGYSNFGGCMHVFAHGTPVCALDVATGGYYGWQGTSFSAPLFSSLAALRFSQSPSATADDVVSYLMSSASSTMTQSGPSGAASTTSAVAILPTEVKTGGRAPTPYDGGVGAAIDQAVAVDGTSNVWTWVLLCLALAVIGLGGFAVLKKRRDG